MRYLQARDPAFLPKGSSVAIVNEFADKVEAALNDDDLDWPDTIITIEQLLAELRSLFK